MLRACVRVRVRACVRIAGSSQPWQIFVTCLRACKCILVAEMCVDMSVDMFVDMSVDMSVDMFVDMSVDMSVDMCIDLHVAIYVNICVGMHGCVQECVSCGNTLMPDAAFCRKCGTATGLMPSAVDAENNATSDQVVCLAARTRAHAVCT